MRATSGARRRRGNFRRQRDRVSGRSPGRSMGARQSIEFRRVNEAGEAVLRSAQETRGTRSSFLVRMRRRFLSLFSDHSAKSDGARRRSQTSYVAHRRFADCCCAALPPKFAAP